MGRMKNAAGLTCDDRRLAGHFMHSHAGLGRNQAGPLGQGNRGLPRGGSCKAPKKNRTLFIGSSSAKRWETLEQDFRSSVGTVIRRGFGEAGIQDATRFADRIILPYKPRQIVLYAGGMRFEGGIARGIATLFDAFVKRVRANCRGHVSRLSPSSQPKAVGQRSKIKQANQLVRVSDDMRLDFIDVWTPMPGRWQAEPKLYCGSIFPERSRVRFGRLPSSRCLLRIRDLLQQPGTLGKYLSAFKEADEKQPPAPGGIVFIGSSSIRGGKRSSRISRGIR